MLFALGTSIVTTIPSHQSGEATDDAVTEAVLVTAHNTGSRESLGSDPITMEHYNIAVTDTGAVVTNNNEDMNDTEYAEVVTPVTEGDEMEEDQREDWADMDIPVLSGICSIVTELEREHGMVILIFTTTKNDFETFFLPFIPTLFQ